MRALILAVAMMVMPFIANAHQSQDKQVVCHKDGEGALHCHVSDG